MNKRIFLALGIFVLYSVSAFGQTDDKTANGREVIETVSKWADAVRSRDAKALDAIFEEFMIVTAADGSVRGKADEIALLTTNPQFRPKSIRNDDIKVRVFDDTAVATAINRTTLAARNRESSLAFRYTAVFVRKEGRWQLVALHAGSPLRPAQ